MRKIANICYAVCIISIAVGLVLILLMIWGDVDADLLCKPLWTAVACFFASRIAFAITRATLEKPPQKTVE